MNQPLNQDVTDSPLKAHGRFGRLSYLAWNLVIGFFATIILILVFAIFGQGFSAESMSLPSIIIAIAIYILVLYYTFVFTIRRLHDRNHSGWLSLLLLVPFVNIIFFLYIIFAKGQAETNNYGAPRETLGWEKVLAWIYIALIVFSIVAAVALPSLFTSAFNPSDGNLLEQIEGVEQEYLEEEYSESEDYDTSENYAEEGTEIAPDLDETTEPSEVTE